MKIKQNIPPQVIQSLLNKVVIMQSEMEILRLQQLIQIEEMEQELKSLSKRIAYLLQGEKLC